MVSFLFYESSKEDYYIINGQKLVRSNQHWHQNNIFGTVCFWLSSYFSLWAVMVSLYFIIYSYYWEWKRAQLMINSGYQVLTETVLEKLGHMFILPLVEKMQGSRSGVLDSVTSLSFRRGEIFGKSLYQKASPLWIRMFILTVSEFHSDSRTLWGFDIYRVLSVFKKLIYSFIFTIILCNSGTREKGIFQYHRHT